MIFESGKRETTSMHNDVALFEIGFKIEGFLFQFSLVRHFILYFKQKFVIKNIGKT